METVEHLLTQSSCVCLDFTGVASITDSFADELFGVLAERYGSRVRQLLAVEHANEAVSDAIAFALEATPAQ